MIHPPRLRGRWPNGCGGCNREPWTTPLPAWSWSAHSSGTFARGRRQLPMIGTAGTRLLR
eukprot:2465922-Alexandrium_andersonii.AAC.1